MSTMRVAVVGAGPAGMYAIESLLERRGLHVAIDLYERLPTPWGLVRAGVAPDHAEKKLISDHQFDWLVRDARVRFIGGVEIGRDITPDELRQRYSAVIFAVGATGDTQMGIPGETLPGCWAAREFVAFYNGHPDFSHLQFDLSCERAVIIGNGNVALDVARILTMPVTMLEKTDIADHALHALRTSRIREVVVFGRREAQHAAFSNSELEEFEHLPGIDVAVEGALPLDVESGRHSMAWAVRRKLDTLRRLTSRPRSPDHRRVIFRFLSSPLQLIGQRRVEQIKVGHNRRTSGDGERGVLDDETLTLDTGLVFRSIGYRGTPMSGLPFDEERAVIRHRAGRVIERDGRVLQGAYVAGWVKRGCRGIIGSNRKCARETVDGLIEDWADGRILEASVTADDALGFVKSRQPQRVTLGGWLGIDRAEREAGRRQQRPRVKLTDAAALFDAAR